MISSATASPQLKAIGSQAGHDVTMFAGGKLFPLFQTKLRSGHYRVFTRASSLDVPASIARAPGAPPSRRISKIGQQMFSAQDYAHAEAVPLETVEMFKETGAAERGATNRARDVVRVHHEIRCHALATGASIPNVTPATKWDQANSTPVDDINAVILECFNASGLRPNLIVCGFTVGQVIFGHPQVKERVTVTGEHRPPTILASLFNVDDFVIAQGVTNQSGNEESIDLAEIWGDSVILAHVDRTGDIEQPSFGRTFLFIELPPTKVSDDADQASRPAPDPTKTAPVVVDGITTDSYEETKTSSRVVRAQQVTDEKVTGAYLGYHISNVLGS